MPRTARSHQYQYLFRETIVPDIWLTQFTNEDALYGNTIHSLAYELANQAAIDWLVEFINTKGTLTDKQRKTVNLYAEGNTQAEVAEILGVGQTTVFKTIFGNFNYVGQPHRYGGAKLKLKKLLIKSKEFRKMILDLIKLEE